MRKIQLTKHEWFDALKVPSPHRNKKKYFRKEKYKKKWQPFWLPQLFFVYSGILIIKTIKVMLKQEFLEYWFGIGKNLGLDDEKAIEYAENQFEDYR
jgi:hypothetical protein